MTQEKLTRGDTLFRRLATTSTTSTTEENKLTQKKEQLKKLQIENNKLVDRQWELERKQLDGTLTSTEEKELETLNEKIKEEKYLSRIIKLEEEIKSIRSESSEPDEEHSTSPKR